MKYNQEKKCLTSHKENFNENLQECNQFLLKLKKFYLEQRAYTVQTKATIDIMFQKLTKQLEDKTHIFQTIQKCQMLKQNEISSKNVTYNPIRKWFLQNYDNPYPEEEELELLSKCSKLPKKKILIWFVNTRNQLQITKKHTKERRFQEVVRLRFLENQYSQFQHDDDEM